MTYLSDGDIVEKNGRRFRINIEADDDASPPWERGDGYGDVSDWTSRDKLPGERVLNSDRSIKRYYDFQASIKIAKRDGWGLGPDEVQKLADKLGRAPTKAEITTQSVENDYEFLRGWCTDQWHYVGVIATDVTDNEKAALDYGHALWGVEDSENSYLQEVAHELIDQILGEVADAEAAEQHEADEVLYWAARDVPTAQAWAP